MVSGLKTDKQKVKRFFSIKKDSTLQSKMLHPSMQFKLPRAISIRAKDEILVEQKCNSEVQIKQNL